MVEPRAREQMEVVHPIGVAIPRLMVRGEDGKFTLRSGGEDIVRRMLEEIVDLAELSLAIGATLQISKYLHEKGSIAGSGQLIVLAGDASHRLPDPTRPIDQEDSERFAHFAAESAPVRAPQFGKAAPRNTQKLSRMSGAIPRIIK
jgi:hypothetical protein